MLPSLALALPLKQTLQRKGCGHSLRTERHAGTTRTVTGYAEVDALRRERVS